jgi:hypothetical protein
MEHHLPDEEFDSILDIDEFYDEHMGSIPIYARYLDNLIKEFLKK